MDPRPRDELGWLLDGPQDAPLTLALAHGAGAPMDSPFMAFFAHRLAAAGWQVLRFEFPYMAARRQGGPKRPPDRQPVLLESWRSVIAAVGAERLAIGGKSLGGRMASLIADEASVRGLVCLGYPFHPPGRPERLRTEHLRSLKTPTLILQGERDPLGGRGEVEGYSLAPGVALHWLSDGDHSLVPRKASGLSAEQNWWEAARAIEHFLAERA
jgi:predicted alpha/beta-hydrolase family hydrolase